MAITFPQTPVSNGFSTAQTSIAASFAAGITAGDFIIVAGMCDSGATTITLSDGNSDTVTPVIAPFANAGNRSYMSAFLTPTAGTQTITATFSGGSTPGFGDICIWVVRGITNPTIDAHPSASGSSAAPASGTTGTLASAAEAAVAYANSALAISGGGGGTWTFDGLTTGTVSGYEHQVLAATTAINGTFTASNAAWNALCATFMAGAATAPSLLPPTFTVSAIPQVRNQILSY